MPNEELQQAIAWFENRLSGATMPGARRMLSMALSALRAQQERENPQPLTLDELREMDVPVWICFTQETWGPNVLVDSLNCSRYKFKFSDYGKTWIAYRTRPKDGEK